MDQQLVYLEEMVPGRGARARSTRSACPTSPRPSCSSAPRSRRSASCARCCAATSSGARGCPSPTPGPTWPRCARRRDLEDDTFVVSGQKTWNSLGRHADWCQLYVRTDPAAPKHKGISCLLVDMASPGITVRPLRTMSGEFIFAELFFDDVVVPRSNLLGCAQRGLAGRHDHAQPRARRRGPPPPRPERALREPARRRRAGRGPIRDAVHRDRLAAPVCRYRLPAVLHVAGSWPPSAREDSLRRRWVGWPSWLGPRGPGSGRTGRGHAWSRSSPRGHVDSRAAPVCCRIRSPVAPATSTATSWPSTRSGLPAVMPSSRAATHRMDQTARTDRTGRTDRTMREVHP